MSQWMTSLDESWWANQAWEETRYAHEWRLPPTDNLTVSDLDRASQRLAEYQRREKTRVIRKVPRGALLQCSSLPE